MSHGVCICSIGKSNLIYITGLRTLCDFYPHFDEYLGISSRKIGFKKAIRTSFKYWSGKGGPKSVFSWTAPSSLPAWSSLLSGYKNSDRINVRFQWRDFIHSNLNFSICIWRHWWGAANLKNIPKFKYALIFPLFPGTAHRRCNLFSAPIRNSQQPRRRDRTKRKTKRKKKKIFRSFSLSLSLSRSRERWMMDFAPFSFQQQTD